MAPTLIPCYYGSVNRWECDENDHQNVRFYAHKINQALQRLIALESGDAALAAELPARIRVQHIRFLQEARAATPLRVDCGRVACSDTSMEVLCLMHQNVTNAVLATFLVTVDLRDWYRPAPAVRVQVPEEARPRGLDPTLLPAPPTSIEAARALGYTLVGQGVIGAEECDPGGRLLPHMYIGRISDAMPNLWAFMNGEAEQAARDTGELGGAALEQRLTVHEPLTVGAAFTQLSGVRALGNKTQQMAHLLFEEHGGRLVASAEAIGVAMDLATRRAVPISAERRQRLEGLLLRG